MTLPPPSYAQYSRAMRRIFLRVDLIIARTCSLTARMKLRATKRPNGATYSRAGPRRNRGGGAASRRRDDRAADRGLSGGRTAAADPAVSPQIPCRRKAPRHGRRRPLGTLPGAADRESCRDGGG